jgi:hypothetical protein
VEKALLINLRHPEGHLYEREGGRNELEGVPSPHFQAAHRFVGTYGALVGHWLGRDS